MRVVCIKEALHKPGQPTVKMGNIYTVLNEKMFLEKVIGEYRQLPGLYYKIIEIGKFVHSHCFIKINDDQQDETEMQRDYNKEKSFS